MAKQFSSAEAALEGVLHNGMLIASGRFGLCGILERLLKAIQDCRSLNLSRSHLSHSPLRSGVMS